MLALVLADPLDYSGEQYGRLLEEPARQFGRIDKLNYLVALILTAPIIIWFALGKFSWIGRGGEEVLSLAVSAVAIYSACFGIVGPLLTFVFLGLLNIIGFVVDAVFFRGMANVLEYKKLDKAVRIGSLVVIAVGFHFDLLTS